MHFKEKLCLGAGYVLSVLPIVVVSYTGAQMFVKTLEKIWELASLLI